MQTTSPARSYSWGGRTLTVTPEAHRDLLRLWSLQHLTTTVTYPPGWALGERAALLHGLAQALGYTDYRYPPPNGGSRPGRPPGIELELIRFARQYTVDTGHVMPGTRLMPSSTCSSLNPEQIRRCFTRHAPTGWRSTPQPTA